MSKTALLKKQYTQKTIIRQIGKRKIIVLPSWFPANTEAVVTVNKKIGKGKNNKITEEDYSGITKNMGVSELEKFLEDMGYVQTNFSLPSGKRRS